MQYAIVSLEHLGKNALPGVDHVHGSSTAIKSSHNEPYV